MVTATFQFHNELNDFLPRQRRQVEFSVSCARKATTKHMIEALGVPHTEVELITVHGEAAGLDRLLSERDRVAVYPRFKVPNGTPHACLRQWPLDGMRFIVDVHLGGLARHLRMAGFDTVYRNDLRDLDIADIAIRDGSHSSFLAMPGMQRAFAGNRQVAGDPSLAPCVQASQDHFTNCKFCGRVFWEGSHWQRMRCLLDAAIGKGSS